MSKSAALQIIAGLFICFSSTAKADLVLAEGAASGQWFNPHRNGEGIFVEIVDTNPSNRVAIAWFTYDKQGNQMWVTGIAGIDQNQTTVTIPVNVTKGPRFGDEYNPEDLQSETFGTITLSFHSCSEGQMIYAVSVPGFGSGSIQLTRLTKLEDVDCEDPAPPPSGTTPVAGRWQGAGLCFFVAADGRSLTAQGSNCDNGRSVDADIDSSNASGACDAEVETHATIAIVDNRFQYSSGGETIIGEFTSSTTANGLAQEVENTTCTAEWTASPAQ